MRADLHGSRSQPSDPEGSHQSLSYSGTEDEELVAVAVEVFSMLADATRIRIVLALADGELSVNTLSDMVGKHPPAVSQHLAKLRLARIVTTRQEGTRVFYRLANEHVRQLVTDALFQAEHSVADHPRHHRSRETPQ